MSQDDGDGYDPYDDAPEWTNEDEDRYQTRRHEENRRRRRRRRQGWSFAVLVLVVLGVGVGGAGISQNWWEWPFGREEPGTAVAPSCAPVTATIAAPADVRLNVLNATDRRGLAGQVGGELTARGYVVASIGNEESDVEVAEPAQVRYGPSLVAAAQSVAVQIPGAVLVDDGREGEVVDVALGEGYQALATEEEAAAAIAAAVPTAPAGCPPSTSETTPPPSTTG